MHQPWGALPEELPGELIEADAAYQRLLEGVAFSRHLNPVNAPAARQAFLRGAEAPPLLYDAPLWAGEALALLRGLVIPRSHPLGAELARAAEETALLVEALRDRTAEAFAALSAACGWGPLIEDLPDPGPDAAWPGGADAAGMRALLEEALIARGAAGWRVEPDPVMASRVLVDGAKRLLRIHPGARFSGADCVGLIAHEIDVHVMRAVAGERQPLHLFRTGLPGAGFAEEGLAIFAEEVAGTLPRRFAHRQRLLHEAIARAETQGFREIYAWLEGQAGPDYAWGACLRIKRGLRSPGGPGCYAKDCVYLRGYRRVRGLLLGDPHAARAGAMEKRALGAGALARLDGLYVGKVGLDHPVGAWVAAGWVAAGRAPAFWRAACGEAA